MTPDRWRQVKDLFDTVVVRDGEEREEYLRRECAGDEELLGEVRRLLAADTGAGLLDRPVVPNGAMAAAAPAREPDSITGRVIGNYLITGELARGGMGIVYRGRHTTLPRDVVVKRIRPQAYSADARAELQARFKREAHIQCQLDHPNIVRVYEFIGERDEYFLVMEYVRGSSLRAVLDRRGALPASDVAALAVQALNGLDHAHNLVFTDENGGSGKGVIHRDIKPANLLMDEHGKLKLTDFGIAKAVGGGGFTKTGVGAGTVEYMSPEQVRNAAVDARSDLYSLGVTLYEMLSGRVPFPRSGADSDYSVMKAHVETEPRALSTLKPDVPRPLANAVMRALRKDPGERWQSAAEFRDAIMAPRDVAARAWRFPWRWVAAMAVLFALAAAVWMWRGRGTSSVAKQTPSIAVLPFLDISSGKNQEWFADGLAEELLDRLAKVQGLRVAGRMSSFQFKGKSADSSTVGRKLKVGSILEGSVRIQGGRTRIDVRLIQADNGFQLWSETYDGDMTDIFAVQQRIAEAVAAALKVKLLGRSRAAQSTTTEAYTAYLEGREFIRRRNRENLLKAAAYFERATQLDSGYAPAWVGLAESRTGLATGDYVPREEGYRKAREAAQRALSIDPDSAQAHAASGRIKMFRDFDWVGADASYQQALALEPGNATVIQSAATLARVLGRLDEAIKLYERAIESDPLNDSAYNSAGIALYYAGLYDRSAAALNKALELVPERRVAHSMLAEVYLAQGHGERARAEAEKENDPAFRLCVLALVDYALGRKREADVELAELIAKHADATYQIAQIYAMRNDKDRAFQWLERAYAERDGGLTEFKGDPLLKNLEGDARYAGWLKRLRLE